MSYGRRYLTLLVFNITLTNEDSDGNQPQDGVSDEQIANIEALITETGSDKVKFLRYLKVSKLSDIPAANYSTVIQLLEAKRARS
jgi:hypothetical protein